MTYDEFLVFLDDFEEIGSFAGKIQAANQNLQRIGSGSGRAVYDIDGTKVLKVAKNQKGVAQNEVEASVANYSDTEHILTRVFESSDDDTWLVAEKAKKVSEKRIKELTGIPSLSVLHVYLVNSRREIRGGRRMFFVDDTIKEQLDENEFVQNLLEFSENYGYHTGDWGKASSYGEVLRDGQPIIVLSDYGLNDEVYDIYYDRRKQQRPYRIYEFIGTADGNDDYLSDIGGTDGVRMGWAMLPYGVDDNAINEIDEQSVLHSSFSDESYATELAEMLTNKVGLPKPVCIGSGSFGYAFRLGNEFVLKLTTSLGEADIALKILKRGQPQFLTMIHDVYKIIDSKTNNAFFAIIQEYIPDRPTELFDRYNDMIDKISPFGYDSFNLIKLIRKGADYNKIVQIAKGILTENPQSNISSVNRTWAYEYIIGLLNIQQELTKFNIKSDDYTNTSNLGYKNGVLKYFDVGSRKINIPEPQLQQQDIIYLPEGEDINEEYNKSVADRIAQQVAVKLGCDQPQYMGSGNFGAAYDIGDNKVLKVTKDKTEAVENLKLIDKPLKYIAQPYAVYRVYSKSGDNAMPETYAIILEKLDTDIVNIGNSFNRLNYVFRSIFKTNLSEVIKQYLEWRNPDVNKEGIDNYLKNNPKDAEFFYDLIKIGEELQQYGVESFDFLHKENLGYKKNGALGFFDVGFGNPFKNPTGAKEIWVKEDSTSTYSTDTAMGQDEFPIYNQNDTSALTDNNVPPVSEDLEYNHVVGDATEDEYMMTERKLSFMPNAKAVTVKKKCQIGGLGNTSAACNQGDINNLEFKKINEEIEAKEARDDEGALQTVLDGKRDIAVVSLKGKPYLEQQINDAGLSSIPVQQAHHDIDTIIVYKNTPKGKAKAKRLHQIMQSYGGYLADQTPEEAYEIGKLLGYSNKSINWYINRLYYKLPNGQVGRRNTEELFQYDREQKATLKEAKNIFTDDTFKDLFKGKKGVAVGRISKNNIRRIEKNGLGIFLLYRISGNTNEWMGIVFKQEKRNVAEKLLKFAKQRGSSLKPHNAEKARTIFSMLEFSEVAIEKYIKKHFPITENFKKKSSKIYYRAIANNAGKTVKFKPYGYYEAIDDEGNPIYKYGAYWTSDKPEVAASHTVGGAVLGLFSMLKQHDKTSNIFFIYAINEEPDIDISHWDMGDFALLQEVRYRRPVRGEYIGKVIINSYMREKLNAYYEMIGGDEYDTPIDDPEYNRQIEIVRNTDYEELLDGVENMVSEENKPTINETLGELDKVYVRTGIYDEEDRQEILNITHGDNYTKFIADVFYYLTNRYNPKMVKPTRLSERDRQILINTYDKIKQYNKNVFPISDIDEVGQEMHPLDKMNNLRRREILIDRLKTFPSILLRNLRADIRKPRGQYEFEKVLEYTRNIQKALELINQVKPEYKEKIFKKVFSSANNTFETVAKRLQDTAIPYLYQEDSPENTIEKINDMGDDAEILYNKNNVLVVKIKTPQAMGYIGCSSQWCFATDPSVYWGQYTSGYDDGFATIVFNFNETPSSPQAMVVVLEDGSVYDMYNEYMDDGYEYLNSLGVLKIIPRGAYEVSESNIINEAIISLQELPFKNDVEERGGNIYSVGGAVRDEFLGKESKDLDVLITGIPMDELEQILSKYGRVDAVGKSFGILKFKSQGGEEIDIAIPRTERPSGEGGHKGFDVTSDYTLPIEKDLERRDFTINAIAKDINGNIVDPFNGREDLKNKIIRVVNPEAFSDDPLRMLRAVQFASRFGFTIEPETMKMIKDNAERIREIPAERILTEFDKIITKGDKKVGAELLYKTGLFKQIFGNADESIIEKIGEKKLFEHVKTMGEFIWTLIHNFIDNPAEFYKNELRGDIDTYKEIKALQLAYEHAEATNLIEARSIAYNMYAISPISLQSNILPTVIKTAANELLQGKYPKTMSELAVNGNDLIELGLKGKEIGDTLKSMLLKVYSNKIENNREDLLALLNDNNILNEQKKITTRPKWNVNGEMVDIEFFVKKYNDWNTQGGDESGYSKPSEASVIEFFENNYEDFLNDETLKDELYKALTKRKALNENKSHYSDTKESIKRSKSIGKEMKDEILKYVSSGSKYREGGIVTGLTAPKIKGKSFKGVGMGADKNGFFVYTHRARSKSHPTPEKITKTEIEFIESTG